MARQKQSRPRIAFSLAPSKASWLFRASALSKYAAAKEIPAGPTNTQLPNCKAKPSANLII